MWFLYCYFCLLIWPQINILLYFQVGLRRPAFQFDFLPRSSRSSTWVLPVHGDPPVRLRPRPPVQWVEAAVRRGHWLVASSSSGWTNKTFLWSFAVWPIININYPYLSKMTSLLIWLIDKWAILFFYTNNCKISNSNQSCFTSWNLNHT